MKIAITGATGQLGQLVIHALLKTRLRPILWHWLEMNPRLPL